MNKADEVYLGKLFVDYEEAILETTKDITGTSDIVKILIEEGVANDMRSEEVREYQNNLKKIILYADSKGISLNKLMEYGEVYKTTSFSNYLMLKERVTIKNEIDSLLSE